MPLTLMSSIARPEGRNWNFGSADAVALRTKAMRDKIVVVGFMLGSGAKSDGFSGLREVVWNLSDWEIRVNDQAMLRESDSGHSTAFYVRASSHPSGRLSIHSKLSFAQSWVPIGHR